MTHPTDGADAPLSSHHDQLLNFNSHQLHPALSIRGRSPYLASKDAPPRSIRFLRSSPVPCIPCICFVASLLRRTIFFLFVTWPYIRSPRVKSLHCNYFYDFNFRIDINRVALLYLLVLCPPSPRGCIGTDPPFPSLFLF